MCFEYGDDRDFDSLDWLLKENYTRYIMLLSWTVGYPSLEKYV